MGKAAVTVPPARRHETLAAIWNTIDLRRIGGPQGGAIGQIDTGNTAGSVTAHGNEGDAVPAIEPAPVKIPKSSMDRIVKLGISGRVVGPLGTLLGVGKGAVAEYLGIDRRTASRRASKDLPLPAHAAEAVLRLLELDQMAVDTFESPAASSSWLRKPHPMLDGESPLECARSSCEAQRVKEMLVAMKYGGVL